VIDALKASKYDVRAMHLLLSQSADVLNDFQGVSAPAEDRRG
jgi:hypothetical protein